MKRKDSVVFNPEEGLNKLKTSVNFASHIHAREMPKKDVKPGKFVIKKLKKKRMKFEKQMFVKTENMKALKTNIKAIRSAKSEFLLHKNDHFQNSENLNEKINWLDFKKKKKILKEQRKVRKLINLYEIAVKAKKIGEKLRLLESSTIERANLSSELHNLLKGHYYKFIMTHDMSRVIQWLFKYSNAEIRESIISEVKSLLVRMFQSKYAKNCVKAAFKYGSEKLRKEMFVACNGHVVELSSHLISAPIFEYAITEFATDLEKIRLKQEFYGDIYKEAKDDNVKILEDVYKNAEVMKTGTLSAVKINLIRILNKKLATSSIVQSVLWEYLSNCSPENRDEILNMLRTLLVDLSRTREGTMAGMLAIWHGTNKDRKIIMKNIKEHVTEICISEVAHILIFALIDCVDDTVILKKIIISEILKNLPKIILNEYGRKVILYIVARRDTHYFHPVLVNFLKTGDEIAISKKPSNVREQEILESVIDTLLESITSEIEIWLSNASIQILTLAILKSNHDKNLNSVFEAIAKFVINSELNIVEGEKEFKVIEHSGLHMILKKLFRMNQIFLNKNRASLGEVFVRHLDQGILEKWIHVNRGCFLLIFILENTPLPTISTLIGYLQSLKAKINSLDSPGSKILMKKLNAY